MVEKGEVSSNKQGCQGGGDGRTFNAQRLLEGVIVRFVVFVFGEIQMKIIQIMSIRSVCWLSWEKENLEQQHKQSHKQQQHLCTSQQLELMIIWGRGVEKRRRRWDINKFV